MDPSSVLAVDAFYSVVRYNPDPARNEARNIAVLVIGSHRRSFFRTAPLSQVTRKLHQQGLLDAILAGFENRVKEGELGDFARLSQLAEALRGPIELTPPRPMAVVGSFQSSSDALFHSLVAVRQRRGAGLSRGDLLDGVVDSFRSKGASVARGSYIGDFIFDAVVHESGSARMAVGVASFDSAAADWTGTERQVGHYLFAVARVQPEPAFVVQPPSRISKDAARRSHERITRWLNEAGVPTISYADVPAFAARSTSGQLWLPSPVAASVP